MLAGPIVRRVERGRCSFWVALSEPATVRAFVWKSPDGVTRSAPITSAVLADAVSGDAVPTRRIAANLHLALVSVDLTNFASPRYAYNLTFTFANSTASDLQGEKLLEDETAASRQANQATLPIAARAPLHKALGFERNALPTFLAAPSTVAAESPADGLRLVHGSCRRAGAGSHDAMAAIAALIPGPAPQRPHQLYLTGDQVYADDIATPLLPLVTALGLDLTGAPQKLPAFPKDPRPGGGAAIPAGVPGDAANLPPLRRKWLLWKLAGFTSGSVENHAIAFGEFAALHLLSWSARVWRAIPAFTEVYKLPSSADPRIEPWLNRPWFDRDDLPADPDEPALKRDWVNPTSNHAFGGYNETANHVARFAGAAPLVAQVLANTPTSMVFDDHDVTDDWNFNGIWAVNVYNSDWGRYVVRNALMAYTVMQAWGNAPSKAGTGLPGEFDAGKPGAKLLDAIPKAIASANPIKSDRNVSDVDILLGFDKPTMAQPARVTFNYAFDGDDYRVVVLDTRTRRALGELSYLPPSLVDNLSDQLPASNRPPIKRVLIVVSAAPVFSPVVVDQIGQPIASLVVDVKRDVLVGALAGGIPGFIEGESARSHAGGSSRIERGDEKYDREGWSANEPAFEALVARLATYKSVVLLSGDVHYASTTTLDYWTKERPNEPTRLVQCISSPLKNVFKRQVVEVANKLASVQRAAEVPMERLAWKEPIDPANLVPAGAHLSRARIARMRKTPALLPARPWPPGSKLQAGSLPDWRWRVETVVDTETTQLNLPMELRLAPLSSDAGDKVPIEKQLAAIATAHQRRLVEDHPPLRRLVFNACFGLVQFEGKDQTFGVIHTLYSPVSTAPFDPAERTSPPSGRPALPQMRFGPHTVHRTSLVTVTTPPDLLPA